MLVDVGELSIVPISGPNASQLNSRVLKGRNHLRPRQMKRRKEVK